MITILPIYRPIGKMTIAQAIDLVRHSLHEQDNARLHDLTLRMYLNTSKLELAESLMSANEPQYTYNFFAQTDPVNDYETYNALNSASNLDGRVNMRMIDMTQEVGQDLRVPIDIVHTIKDVHLLGHGVCIYVPASDLFSMANDTSFFARQSVYWTFYADKIYIVQGLHVVDVTDTADLDIERYGNAIYEILSYRYPQSDDFLIPSFSATYNVSADVPPKIYRTLIMLTQKLALESLGKSLVPEAEQMLANALQTLSGAKEQSLMKGQSNE